ncbi:MAG TPA: D-alanyl-D-alanine carboxypeptidase family protein [Burkholderiales bacterium]|nr:D-alanyl-D-alanine carboxypeptidase family protein [Burkholderiales bacterium]
MIRFLALALAAGHLTIAQAQGGVAPPQLSSRSWLLLDYQSRQVLAAHNPGERVEPASLTKLMTAYVVFDALRQKQLTLAQAFTASERAWRAPGSRMFLKPGENVTVEDLLSGLIVQSGNDAAITLAEGTAGSEEAFVEAMNREAARMGMKGTHFANATGLPHPQHYTTATDLATLSRAIIEEFPQYFPLYKMREFRHNGITQYNRNQLLGRDPYVDGLKTGYTESAGFCMVASAQRRDRRVIAVVLNAGSENGRAADAQKLLNYGFEGFDTFKLYAGGQPIHELPVWKGNSKALQAGLAEDFFVSLPHGFSDRLKATMESMQPLMAPIRAGDKVGTLRLTFDGKFFADKTVVALETVGIANVFVRSWDSLRLLYRGLAGSAP